MNPAWEQVARFVVAAFRADAARAGAGAEVPVNALVQELRLRSAEFATLWADNDVRHHGEGVKQIRHPVLGEVSFEYSAFAVDGRPDLGLIVYNPATAEDLERVRLLVSAA